MSSFCVRLLTLVAAFALTTSCSSQSGTPSTTDATIATTGALTPATSSSTTSGTITPPPTTASSNPAQSTSGNASAPSTTTGGETTVNEAAESEAALTAYRGFYEFLNQAYANPSADWSQEIKKWAAGPAAEQVLAQLSSLAQAGQYGTGAVTVEPKITGVQPALVDIQSCVDSTNIGLFDRNGQSIKSPDGPGTYFRHPSTAQVGQFQGGAWLVVAVSDDYSVTC